MAEIERLLQEARHQRAQYALQRNMHAVGSGPRRDLGLEALACVIREQAFKEALAALKTS